MLKHFVLTALEARLKEMEMFKLIINISSVTGMKRPTKYRYDILLNKINELTKLIDKIKDTDEKCMNNISQVMIEKFIEDIRTDNGGIHYYSKEDSYVKKTHNRRAA